MDLQAMDLQAMDHTAQQLHQWHQWQHPLAHQLHQWLRREPQSAQAQICFKAMQIYAESSQTIALPQKAVPRQQQASFRRRTASPEP